MWQKIKLLDAIIEDAKKKIEAEEQQGSENVG